MRALPFEEDFSPPVPWLPEVNGTITTPNANPVWVPVAAPSPEAPMDPSRLASRAPTQPAVIETRDALTRINQLFHKTLYALNPNQAAIPLIESVWLQLGPFQRQVIEHIDPVATEDHHKEMLSALRERDLPALCAAIEADVHDGSIRAGRQMLQMPAQPGP